MRGTMLWFNEEKGYGYISTEDAERLYVHRDGFAPGHVPEGRCAGISVSFERESASGVPGLHQAVGVAVVDETPARRARRRGHAGRIG